MVVRTRIMTKANAVAVISCFFGIGPTARRYITNQEKSEKMIMPRWSDRKPKVTHASAETQSSRRLASRR